MFLIWIKASTVNFQATCVNQQMLAWRRPTSKRRNVSMSLCGLTRGWQVDQSARLTGNMLAANSACWSSERSSCSQLIVSSREEGLWFIEGTGPVTGAVSGVCLYCVQSQGILTETSEKKRKMNGNCREQIDGELQTSFPVPRCRETIAHSRSNLQGASVCVCVCDSRFLVLLELL